MREEEQIAAWEENEENKKKIQPKADSNRLEISQPEDAAEKEADEVAKHVVEGSTSNVQGSKNNSTISTKSEGNSALYADDKLQRSLDSSKGSGQTMDDSVKGEMESKMGADFSGVKIHTGTHAHEMSEDINAKAFTHGQDIYFKNGNYDPNSSGGKNLLAHELQHTVQNNGNGVQRKIQRQIEDINTVSNQAREMTLDDYTGLMIQVLGGFITVYSNSTGADSTRVLEKDTFFRTGKKKDNRYEVLEDEPVSSGDPATVGGSPKGKTEKKKTEYVEIITDGADFAIIELLPERLLYRAQENAGDDLSYYTIKVKWSFLTLYTDPEAKTTAREKAGKNQQLALLEKNEQGNYPVDIPDGSGKPLRRYLKDKLSKSSFELISVSQSRFAYNANKDKAGIENLSGYEIRIKTGDIVFYQYPNMTVVFDSAPLPVDSVLYIDKEIADEFYQAAYQGKSGYIKSDLALNKYEIFSAATQSGIVISADGGGADTDREDKRKVELATVNYSTVQNILQLAGSNPGKNIKGFNKAFDLMTNAEISVLRGGHRMLLLKTLINCDAKRGRIVRVLENTGMEVTGEMHDYLMADKVTHDKLFDEFSDSDEEKKRMGAAIGSAAGVDDFRITELKDILASDDFSEIDELAYSLSDADMYSLDNDTRADLIDAMIVEANYYWHISSDEDDETMVRLVKTANRDERELATFKKRIHPSFSSEADNLYNRLMETMNTDQSREFLDALQELYPDEVNTELVSELREQVKHFDDESWFFSGGDAVIESVYRMSPRDLAELTVDEKVDIMYVFFDEVEIGAEEETALVNILASLAPDDYPEMADRLEAFDFHILHELVSRIDEDPGATDIRTALNPILEDSDKLIWKCINLLVEKSSWAESYMFLLTDTMLERLPLIVREAMIEESTDYWADGTDETVIIRLVRTTQGEDRQKLYDWFQLNNDTGFTNRQNWVRSSVDGTNRDLFLQEVGALKTGDMNTMLADAKTGFEHGKEVGSDSKVLDSVGMLTNDQMNALDLTTRLEYIRYIVNETGIVWTHGENIVTRLIQNTPTLDEDPNYTEGDTGYKDQITGLFDELSKDGGKFYKQIHEALDDESFDAMQLALQNLVIDKGIQDKGATGFAEENERMRQMGGMHQLVFPAGIATSVFYQSDGRLHISFKLTASGNKENARVFLENHPGFTMTKKKIGNVQKYIVSGSVAPTDMIGLIRFTGDNDPSVVEMNSATQSNTRVEIIPAIGLFQYKVDQERQDLEAALIMLDIILLAVGIGEITMAVRGIRLAFAIADVAIGAAGLAVKPFRKKLMESEEGRVFLGILDGITMAYGVVGLGRLTAALYSMGKVMRLKNQLNAVKSVLKDAEIIRSLELMVGKLENPTKIYKSIFGITSQSDFDDAIKMIDTFPGLTRGERDALKKLADLKLANPSKGPRAFLDYLGNTPEEMMNASKVKNEADLIAFRNQLDEMEKNGKLTPKAREDAELQAMKSIEKQAEKLIVGLKKASGRKYKTKAMNSKYKGEETGSVWGTKVKYLTESERSELQLFIGEDGKAYNIFGKPMDTSSASSVFAGGGGKAIFVMDENGRIFVSNYQEVGLFHHSSILGGNPVAAAGEIEIKNGVILFASRKSGHYWPEAEFLDQFKTELRFRGVDTNKIKFDTY